MDTVVEHDMDQVFRPIGADRRERAHFHQDRAIAVERDNLAARVQRHAEGHAAGAAHRADLVQMLVAVVEGEQLAPRFPGRGDNPGAVRHQGEMAFQRLNPGRARAAFGIVGQGAARRQGALRLVQFFRRDRSLGHDEGER